MISPRHPWSALAVAGLVAVQLTLPAVASAAPGTGAAPQARTGAGSLPSLMPRPVAAVDPLCPDLSNGLSSQSGLVAGTSWVDCSASDANGLTSYRPSTFVDAPAGLAVLTTGSTALIPPPNELSNDGRDNGTPLTRGAYDVSTARISVNVPPGDNCLSFDASFASEEFPEYVGTAFNDGFIAELDQTTWLVDGSTISAPNNFAKDSHGNVISVNNSLADDFTSDTGLEYDGATVQLTARTPVTAGAHSLYLSIFDAGDHIYDSAAFLANMSTFHASSSSLCTSSTNASDSDKDGLPDDWERFGVTVQSDGSTAAGHGAAGTFLNLPAMGADPLHKDLFVHLDNMGAAFALKPAALQIAMNSFNAAPLDNPDGVSGIHLHVDAGPGSVMNPVSGATWGSLSKAGPLADRNANASNLTELKADHFTPARRFPAFYYACACDKQPGTSSSGQADGIPGSGFVITLGAWPTKGGTVLQQAGTFLHEFGHALGLGHGGAADLPNWKPNYLSVMSYAYQTTGIPLTSGLFAFDFSRFDSGVDESSLSELNGIGYSGYYMYTRNGSNTICGDSTPDYRYLSPPSIDWNASCSFESDTYVSADVNGDGTIGWLAGNVDWRTGTTEGSIQFRKADGLASGSARVAGAADDEPTAEDLLNAIPPEVRAQQASSPVPAFTADTTSGKGPLTVHFNGGTSSDPDGTIATYSWDFGDGATGTGVSPSHQYTGVGTFTASLTVTDNAGNSGLTLAERTITVNPENAEPIAGFTQSAASGRTSVTVQFDASDSYDPDGTVSSYAWNWGDGTTGSGKTALHTYSSPGNYEPVLTVTDDDAATGKSTGSVTVGDVPAAPTGVSAVAGVNSATVSWQAPDAHNSPINGYMVTSSPAGGTASVAGNATSAVVSGLTAGTSYTFTVRATNGYGSGPASAASNAVTPTGSGAVVVQDTSRSVTLSSWVGVADTAASGGGYRQSSTKTATATWKFTGTSLSYMARTGPTMGMATVLIDGVNKGLVDLYASVAGSRTTTYSGLASKAHSVVVKVAGSKNAAATGTAVTLDGFAVGTKQTDDTVVTVAYSAWQGKTATAASGGSYRFAASAGSTASLTFTGTGVDLTTARGKTFGKAEIIIDGTSRGTIDLYAATAQWGVKLSYPLASGTHTITLKALGTKNPKATGTQVPLDAITTR
ncbi:MAG: hypothetical protein JWQ99_3391 [Blastococcus sp.]|jgi:PKD repeat protein|nr:hypothetical protein [Blastococcus sp.]